MSADELKQTWNTANTLWSEYQQKKKDANFANKDITDKISHFQQAGYTDFINKYVIPTRYMLMYNEYNRAVFWKYLLRLKTKGYRSKDEWADRQADYVKMLWRAYNPHGNNSEANAQWLYARDSIKSETEAFERDYEKAQIKAKEKEQEILENRRETLKQLLNDAQNRSRLETIYEVYKQAVSTDNATQPADSETKQPKEDTPVSRRQAIRDARKKEKLLAQERERERRARVAEQSRFDREQARAKRAPVELAKPEESEPIADAHDDDDDDDVAVGLLDE